MDLLILGAGASCGVILNELSDELRKVYLYDISFQAAEKRKEEYPELIEILPDEKGLLEMAGKEIDFVIEVAAQSAAKEWTPFFLQNGKRVIVLSIGVFADKSFREKIAAILQKTSGELIIPNGAVGGFDVLKSIDGKIKNIKLKTRKPPRSLNKDVEQPTTVFRGTATEAIAAFPKNINVAVALSFLLGDFSLLEVEIVADPQVERNIHEITVESSAGNYFFRFENFPSFNPKTSLLAPLSIVGYLKSQLKNVSFGG